MSNIDTQLDDEAPTGESTPDSDSPARKVDLANRPDAGWLDEVEGEINDIDLVLKCLGRDSAKICQTCDTAKMAGNLEGRPMLARCASTKQPR